MQTAAESWGTGRAVSRIPRVPGGGTHRAGQGAFGNMCRGGRMFSPTKTWRRWCHKINKAQKRYATASALAASSETSLVKARGHLVDEIPELPLVVSDDIESYMRTKQAVNFLKRVGAYDDVLKASKSRQVRKGAGKKRNRRHQIKKGPLVVYKTDNGCYKAFRNIPGLDICPVDRLNILTLAPGAHVGRLIIWTESAFKELNNIFGSYGKKGAVSKLTDRAGRVYKLPMTYLVNSDISSIIQSDAVQNAVRDKKIGKNKTKNYYQNPFRNKKLMASLNPVDPSLKE